MLRKLRIIKKIKDVLSKNTYPPNFSPEKWKNVKANCYAYALDIAVNDKRQEVWIPGCICDKKTKKGVWNSVTYNIKKDLDFLGILYRENDSYLKEGEYRIAIYYKYTLPEYPIQFHISRQDNDGIWSEKPSWSKKVTRIGEKSDTPPDITKFGMILEDVLIISKK